MGDGGLDPVVELVEMLVKALVDDPGSVEIRATESGGTVLIEIKTAQEDIGKVIGKQGRIIRALRIVARAAAAHENKRVTIEVLS